MKRNLLWILLLFAVAGCGGGGSSPSYTIDGSVTGLLPGTSVTLQNNGGNNTTVSVNSAFAFSTPLVNASNYAVTIVTQPIGETCAVANGSGVVSGADVSVKVTCTPNSYSVGGTVAGLLAGNTVVLAINAASGAGINLSVTANGAFTFSPALTSGSVYTVTVASQPTGQLCSVTNGSGTLGGANITNANVSCSTQSYSIGVTILGSPTVAGLVLQDNGGDNLSVSTSGSYSFSEAVPSTKPYAVSILTQPTGSTCFVSAGSGTVAGTNVSVTVICPWHVAYYATVGETQLAAYYIDGATGAFFENPNIGGFGAIVPQSVPSTPNGVAADPLGRFLFVSSGLAAFGSSAPGQVSAFAIDPANGALTAVPGSPFAWDAYPSSVTVDPSGKFLYTANGSSNNISAYTINGTTGALTEIPGSPFSAGTNPAPVTITAADTFLYTSNTGDSTISAYTINATTGSLTPVAGSPFATATALSSVIVDPNGKFIYGGPLSGSSALWAYGIDPGTGVLSAVAGSPFAATIAGSQLPGGGQFAFDSTGQFLYSPGLIVDSVDPTTGAVTQIAGSPFAFGADYTATAVVVDPSDTLVYAFDQQMRPDGSGTAGFLVNPTSGSATSVGSKSITSSGNFVSIVIVALP